MIFCLRNHGKINKTVHAASPSCIQPCPLHLTLLVLHNCIGPFPCLSYLSASHKHKPDQHSANVSAIMNKNMCLFYDTVKSHINLMDPTNVQLNHCKIYKHYIRSLKNSTHCPSMLHSVIFPPPRRSRTHPGKQKLPKQ